MIILFIIFSFFISSSQCSSVEQTIYQKVYNRDHSTALSAEDTIFYLSLKPVINTFNCFSSTILCLAIFWDDYILARFLVEHCNANVNASLACDHRNTPLVQAIFACNIDIVRFLIQKGAIFKMRYIKIIELVVSSSPHPRLSKEEFEKEKQAQTAFKKFAETELKELLARRASTK